ncbi:amino acid adenylation domain-containing protein [Pseudomonas chlororaphis]|uniref:amino acid adenylation domain-containing protein n=1 Tax=Pseudomonas chlororaphis TaxID=587753 RepID=UPI001E3B95C9|nr:amino acid adenylation domain-containing protein [Pseudomonas chlororaphis]MCB2256473.1 amino acid adenylation domain-containing protein [Pseudomonas chlororaphis]
MRRLDIVLSGRSQALEQLATELASHGHLLRHLDSPQTIASAQGRRPDLLIDDGSLGQPASWAGTAQLQLRVALIAPAAPGLPQVRVVHRYGNRLIAQASLAAPASGNGQDLRGSAVASLVASSARLVSGFSRSAAFFEQLAPLDEPPEPLLGLEHLDALAFEHRHNQQPAPALLREMQVPIARRIDQSLLAFAERAALNIQGLDYSYQTLHRMSLRLQRQMRRHLPANPTQPPVIGLCLPKSAALYAGILATLGCGAVYLPLDPEHPAQRRRFILDNAGAALLLHDGREDLGDLDLPQLDVHALAPDEAEDLGPLLRQTLPPEAPCVAIYTSGTTGQPKGVLLSQGNLSHFCAWYIGHVELNADSRVLQFSTINFDASLLDILPTLLCGALLVVPDPDQRRDPQQLLALLQRQRVSHAFLPPALLSILPLDQPLGLRHLVTGGDVCEPFVIQRLADQCALHNIYGPTETTVLATTHRFQAGDSPRHLGLPIANSQVLILDEQRQPVAERTPGELYLAGPGVGLGYLNNPTLSAERYLLLDLPDGRRLRVYRTGDIGQWTDSGIEICGRRDNQVKIRGFRVEPEEIEHCLRDSQLYRQVAVVIDEQRRILACLTQPSAPGDALPALRAWMRQRLPDYMQPGAYLELPSMPYTANGKVDRRALLELPRPSQGPAQRRPPRNASERRLLELWAGLLELPAEDIGTDDSFFNLGGHSILLSRLLLAVREAFGRSPSISRFIEAPTLGNLATLLDGAPQGGPDPALEQVFADAAAELDLQVLPVSRLGDVHKVVVTGANSFLGVHIVQALLEWGASEVACLVRETPGQTAAERFAQALRDNRLEHLDLDRVRVHAADISQPQLGLAADVYARIDLEYGALVHNAANVNHVLDYPALVRDNVEPLFECLRLCEGRSKKVFNFVSTLSAASSVDAQGRVLELPPAATPPIYIRNGYNLSKWVGERLLQRAREQGVWVNLYRPGNISFNSQTGVCQPHRNRLMLMLKGSLQLGQVPQLAMNFDLMPVDFLARFIAFHASRYQPAHAVFNLHNPQPLNWEAYVASFREAGREFRMVSVADWQRQLGRVDHDNALFGVLGFYLNGFEEDIGDISLIGHANAEAGVRRMGADYPAKDRALLRKGCQYLKDIRFI